MGKEQFTQKVPVVDVVVDKAGEDRLSSRVDDPGLFGKTRFSRGHSSQAVALDHDGGILDRPAAAPVYQSRSFNDDRIFLSCHYSSRTVFFSTTCLSSPLAKFSLSSCVVI